MLTTDLNLGVEHQRVEARHRLVEGEQRFCALSWGADPLPPETVEDAVARLDETARVLAPLARRRATSPTTPGGSTCSARRSP